METLRRNRIGSCQVGPPVGFGLISTANSTPAYKIAVFLCADRDRFELDVCPWLEIQITSLTCVGKNKGETGHPQTSSPSHPPVLTPALRVHLFMWRNS
jgi:hypothetical protein